MSHMARRKREEADKKKKHQQEAAQCYASFVQSFAPDSPRVAQLAAQPLPFAKPSPFGLGANEPVSASKASKKGKKKSRAIDAFMEEMKREKEMKDARASMLQRGIAVPPAPVEPQMFPPDRLGGHHDTGDPNTTNIYVGNLAPEITEPLLAKEFGAFGNMSLRRSHVTCTSRVRDVYVTCA